ncbi:hypothetical protein BJ170DRAFT_677367 [Xylariales sp. AK1849]|nr:hypothetical protein BJ170DRAFT_677367 [Xylariales sp. AK1849]
MLAGMTTRVSLESSSWHNEEWFDLCVNYPMDVRDGVYPTSHFMNSQAAREMDDPEAIRSRAKTRSGAEKPDSNGTGSQIREATGTEPVEESREKDTLLEWMAKNARGDTVIPEKVASRQLILNLPSIHTTAMAVSNALYHLCVHPEYIEPLAEKILTNLQGPELARKTSTICKK